MDCSHVMQSNKTNCGAVEFGIGCGEPCRLGFGVAFLSSYISFSCLTCKVIRASVTGKPCHGFLGPSIGFIRLMRGWTSGDSL